MAKHKGIKKNFFYRFKAHYFVLKGKYMKHWIIEILQQIVTEKL